MPRLKAGMLLFFLFPLSSMAATRTFVASSGSDLNPCSRSAPCRSFAAAIAVTDVDGEVIVLDSAGYGPVTITQSVSLTTPAGLYAGVTATAGDAVTVTIASTDRVILTGLTISGLGGNNGIHFTSAGKLRVESVLVTNFLNTGILGDGGGNLSIDHSTVRAHRQFYSFGIWAYAPSPTALLNIANTLVQDAFECIYVSANVVATVVDSQADQCVSRAFRVYGTGDLTIERSIASNSSEGLLTGCTGGTARISNSTFTGNITDGVRICSGIVYTRGNNTFGANGTDVSTGTLTPLAAQ